MKKTIAIILALIMLLALTACGGKSAYDSGYYESAKSGSYYSNTTAAAPAEAPMAASEEYWGGDSYEYSDYAAETVSSTAGTGEFAENTANKNVKLIYRANMSVQTTDFQQTYQSLVNLVNANGGYFESSNVQNGGYFSDGSYMYGYYTVRVPSQNYAAFVNAVGSACHVVNLNESVQDVGLQYFEIESRLETLRIKEDRLHDLLSQAENMTDIIDLENALSDCEYEIDMYKSSLNRYDSLIGYSTIDISIEKVTVYTPAVQEELTFMERMEMAFERGTERFRENCEDFAVWCSENVFNILLWVIIILIVWAIHPIRRIRESAGRRSYKNAGKQQIKAEKRAAKAAKKAAKHAKKHGGAPVYTQSGENAADAGWSEPAYVENDQNGNPQQ